MKWILHMYSIHINVKNIFKNSKYVRYIKWLRSADQITKACTLHYFFLPKMNKYNIQHCSRKSKYEVSLHGLFWEMLIVHFVHLYRSAAWVSTVYEDIKSVLLYLAVPDSVSVLVEWGLKHCFCIIAHCDQRGFSICKFLNRKSCPTHFTRLMKFPSFRNQRLTNIFFFFWQVV